MNQVAPRITAIKTVATSQFDSDAFVRNPADEKRIDFAYSLRPIYYFSRGVGLLPFSFIRNSNGEIQGTRVTVLDSLWFVTSICMYLFMAFICYKSVELPRDPNHSLILVIGDSLLIISGLVYSAVAVIVDMSNRVKIVNVLKKLTEFDKEVGRFGHYIDYRKRHRRVLFCHIVAATVTLLLAVSSFLANNEYLIDYSTFEFVTFFWACQFQHFVAATLITTYVILIFTLHGRFNVLNALLRKQFLSKNTMRLPINKCKEDSIIFIKFIGRMHDLLTGIMDKINYCYSLQVMGSIGATFVFSIFTFYTLYRYILQQNDFYAHFTKLHLTYQFFYMIYTNMVVYAGSLIGREGKRTSQILHNIINTCSDSDVAAALTQLSQQLQHRSPVASCGLFTFDYTLTYNMIAAITTYVTIIVQFDRPYESGGSNQTSTS